MVVWGLSYNSYIKPIFYSPEESCKGIAFENCYAPSSPIFLALQLLKLQDLFELKLLSFVYESVHEISVSCFHGLFSLVSNVHQHHTRQAAKSDIFLTRKFTLQYGLKSVRYTGAKSWSSIPIQIKQAVSIHTFRRQVKHYLFSINHQS